MLVGKKGQASDMDGGLVQERERESVGGDSVFFNQTDQNLGREVTSPNEDDSLTGNHNPSLTLAAGLIEAR